MTTLPLDPGTPGSPRTELATVLSAAITRRRLTLDRLAVRLARAGTPVSVASLSYWSTGRSLPTRPTSHQALANLEQILELPPGALLETLDTCPPPPVPAELPEPVLDAMRTLGLPTADHHGVRLVFSSYQLGDRARMVAQTTRVLHETRSRRTHRLGMILHAGGLVDDVHLQVFLGGQLDELRLVQPPGPTPQCYAVVAVEVPGPRPSRVHLVACRAEWRWADDAFDSCGSIAAAPPVAVAQEVDTRGMADVAFSVPDGDDLPVTGQRAQHHLTGAPAGRFGIVRTGPGSDCSAC